MVCVPGVRTSKPPAEPPESQSVFMSSGVVVLTMSQLPSASCVTSFPLEDIVVVPADLPSSMIVTVSPAFTEDGRCAVVVNVTGLEQLTVDGVNVIAAFDPMFR